MVRSELWMQIEMCVKIILSFFVGLIIGYERKRTKHSYTILRTHVLVCLGATLATLCGVFINEYGTNSVDLARIPAQVLPSVGFMGMAVIMKRENKVTGLSTAASIWLIACLGIAIGLGFFTGVLFTTILALITLIKFVRPDEKEKDQNEENNKSENNEEFPAE